MPVVSPGASACVSSSVLAYTELQPDEENAGTRGDASDQAVRRGHVRADESRQIGECRCRSQQCQQQSPLLPPALSFMQPPECNNSARE